MRRQFQISVLGNRVNFYNVLLLSALAIMIGACADLSSGRSATLMVDRGKSLEDESLFKKVKIYDKEGTAHLPAMAIPQSNALSAESIDALKKQRDFTEAWEKRRDRDCPKKLSEASPQELPAIRRCRHEAFKKTAWYKDIMGRYDVAVAEKTIGGIVTDIYTPTEGVDEKNRHRVLMHLHGGGQTHGNRWGGYLAATPIAAVGKVKVISVDFRQWPEATHPAAVEDAVVVYKSLLTEYRPENIGIYGCSSGGAFTAQTIPWIEKAGLGRPGAIGVFGMGLTQEGTDSVFAGLAWSELSVPTVEELNYQMDNMVQYYPGADRRDPYFTPGASTQMLDKFPPTLFVSSTRDYSLSRAAYGHSLLVKQGVEADLHVWEGLAHCFIGNTNLPESHDAFKVITDFFDRHLGTQEK